MKDHKTINNPKEASVYRTDTGGSDLMVSLSDYEALAAECEELRKDAESWRSIVNKKEPGKRYGCHCDLDEGMEPDGCVIDAGERHNCIYAKDIEVKEQCEYWRIIATDSDMQDTPS